MTARLSRTAAYRRATAGGDGRASTQDTENTEGHACEPAPPRLWFLRFLDGAGGARAVVGPR